MENNLSAPLTEISEKLTTISEEVKEPQKEDRPISTGKTCPYRRTILWTAVIVQAVSYFSAQSIATYIHPMAAVFLLAFSYIVTSLAGETLVYRVIGKKESAKAQAEAVQEKYGMTLSELDIYIQKLVNIRLLATTVVLASVGYAYVFYGLPWYAFWFIYLATTFISMLCIRMRGKIKVPKRFFLFDLPRGDPNAPLMKNKEGFFASDYDNNWHRYDTSVLKRERN